MSTINKVYPGLRFDETSTVSLFSRDNSKCLNYVRTALVEHHPQCLVIHRRAKNVECELYLYAIFKNSNNLKVE